jgi:hypothetical protein
MNLKATIAVSLASIAVLASAQTDTQKPIGVGIRAGAFLPTDSSAKSAGDAWLDFGLDFNLHQLSPTSSLVVSADYAFRDDFRSLPLLVNYVVRTGPVYLLGGVGGNFSRIARSNGSTDDKGTFAYDLGIGYDVLKNGGSPIYVEGRFFGNSKTELNGFGVFVGVRL